MCAPAAAAAAAAVEQRIEYLTRPSVHRMMGKGRSGRVDNLTRAGPARLCTDAIRRPKCDLLSFQPDNLIFAASFRREAARATPTSFAGRSASCRTVTARRGRLLVGRLAERRRRRRHVRARHGASPRGRRGRQRNAATCRRGTDGRRVCCCCSSTMISLTVYFIWRRYHSLAAACIRLSLLPLYVLIVCTSRRLR